MAREERQVTASDHQILKQNLGFRDLQHSMTSWTLRQ